MKLLGCLGALAACLAVVTGCGGGGGSGGSDSGTLTISSYDLGGAPDPLDKAAAGFEKANPGVKVDVKRTAFTQYAQALRQQLSTNQAPDLARAVLGYGEASSATALAEKGLLADFGDASWIGEIPAAAKSSTEYEGGTFAYPVDATAIGIFYLPSALKEAGVTAAARARWSSPSAPMKPRACRCSSSTRWSPRPPTPKTRRSEKNASTAKPPSPKPRAG
jgi:ABC-type glycerol-3-phosphate transport system substrate-binding protein